MGVQRQDQTDNSQTLWDPAQSQARTKCVCIAAWDISLYFTICLAQLSGELDSHGTWKIVLCELVWDNKDCKWSWHFWKNICKCGKSDEIWQHCMISGEGNGDYWTLLMILWEFIRWDNFRGLKLDVCNSDSYNIYLRDESRLPNLFSSLDNGCMPCWLQCHASIPSYVYFRVDLQF